MTIKPDLFQFLKKLLVFSLILGIITVVLYFLIPSKFYSPAVPFLFFFFFSVTFLNYYILSRASGKKFIRFINYYILSTALKLILFIAVLVTYILLNRGDALPFGIWFFSLYLFYTFYEVIALVGNLKSNQE